MTLHAAHDDILATAEKLFARHAYAEVSLRQLIAASKLSTTAFYARFDSKDAVLDTLAARLFTELAAGATAALRGAPDLAAGIDAGVALLVAHFVPRKALVRLVVTEAGGAVDPARSLRRASYAMLAAFLAKRLGWLARKRRIAVADPHALAWALVGALEIQIVRWAVWDELAADDLPAALRATARAILPKERT